LTFLLILVKNLPKFYGYGELKKLINVTLGLECNKVKIPRKNCQFGFICMRNEEDREKALKLLDGYTWKGKVLTAHYAKPAHDPMFKKRKQEDSTEGGQNKKPRNAEQSSEPLGNLTYEEQLDIKQKKIEEVLKQFKIELKKANDIQKRSGRINDDLICELRPIIGSPLTEGYRNKCEFTIGRTVDGEILVGNRLSTYASGCTSVGNIENLKMPTEKMKQAAKLVQEFVVNSGLQPFDSESYEGHFRNITIRQSRKDSLMLIIGIHPQELTEEEKEKLQKSFVKFFTEGAGKVLDVTSLYYEEIQRRQSGQQANVIKHIYGETHIKESLLGLNFRISPNSFFQANSAAAENLYQLAIDLADVKKDTTILDICCGTGTIGLCFAKHCKHVYGMEIIPEAIADAKVNAEDNGIKNSSFASGNADDLIFSMVKQAALTKDDEVVAIVDPPRAGLQV
jgi:tRNA (uracil-5-)-methyltransferase